MLPVRGLAALGPTLAGLALLVAQPAAGGGSATIDSFGIWTLRGLGYGDLVLEPDPETARAERTIYYRLPRDAAQGPGHWYVLHLHYVVELRPDATPGIINVAAATNGRFTISTIFTARKRGGRLVVTSDDLGWVEGHVRRTSTSLSQEIKFSNFLAYAGVRPGRNALTFQVTANAIPLVRSVRILRDTAIEVSPHGPADVRLALTVDRSIRAGDTFAVNFRLRRVRGRLVDWATIQAHYPRGALRLKGNAVRRVRWGSSRPLNGTFTFEALRPGRFPLELVARAGPGSPSARTSVHVGHQRDGFPYWALAIPVLSGAAFALAWKHLLGRNR